MFLLVLMATPAVTWAHHPPKPCPKIQDHKHAHKMKKAAAQCCRDQNPHHFSLHHHHKK